MQKQRHRALLTRYPIFFFLFSFLFFPIFSCRTAPKTVDNIFIDPALLPLEPGASAYIIADVQSIKPFLNIDDKQVQQMIDRTQFAAAAMYFPHMAPGVMRRYQLAASGSYPASGAKMAMGNNKHWQKLHSPVSKNEYWYSAESGLSIAVTATTALVSAVYITADHAVTENTAINYTEIDPFSAGRTAVPDGFNTFSEGSILSCWINDPGPTVDKRLAEAKVPLKFPANQLFISIYPLHKADDGELMYEARLRAEFANAAQARTLTVLLAIAHGEMAPHKNASQTDSAKDHTVGGNFADMAALFFANPPVQDDKYLTIKTNPLSARYLSLLFRSFSLW